MFPVMNLSSTSPAQGNTFPSGSIVIILFKQEAEKEHREGLAPRTPSVIVLMGSIAVKQLSEFIQRENVFLYNENNSSLEGIRFLREGDTGLRGSKEYVVAPIFL